MYQKKRKEGEEEVKLNKYNPYYGNIMSIKMPYVRKKISAALIVGLVTISQ
jgi:hypothetical protein